MAKMPYRWDSKTNLDYLKYLSIAQLRELLEDEETIGWTVTASKKLQDLQKQAEVKRASNCRLAEQNLSYQPYLTNNKLLLAEKYQSLSKLMASLRRKQKKMNSVHRRLSLKVTHQVLKQKVAYSMDESESLWLKFLEGKLLLMDFVESFPSTRKFYYKQLIQVEKIQDFSTQTQQQQQQHRMEALSTAGLLSSDPHLQSAVNVFCSLSPVIMLPNNFLPLMGRSFLPPLNHHQCGGDLWTSYIPVINPGPSLEFKTIWPKRSAHLQHHEETKDHILKPSQ